jgi:hypothetical protein
MSDVALHQKGAALIADFLVKLNSVAFAARMRSVRLALFGLSSESRVFFHHPPYGDGLYRDLEAPIRPIFN